MQYCKCNMWWWSCGVKDDIQRKYEEITKNPTEETQNVFRRLKKAAKKTVARAMKEEAVRRFIELGSNPT